MYWQPAPHPRAGVAIGAAILAAWLGALGVAFASSDPAEPQRVAVPAAEQTSPPQAP
jgi:hypothetical protein